MIITQFDLLIKSNLHHARSVTPQLVLRGGLDFQGLAPGTTTAKKRRSGGEQLATVSDLTGQGTKPQTS